MLHVRFALPALPALPALVAVAACGPGPVRPEPFDGEAALAYAAAQLDFGPRIPGTDGHRRMARWLEGLLRERADTVIVQAWDHTTVDGVTLPMRNLLARFNPGATARLLFVAHWDTRPRADAPGSPRPDAPVPGANDGASGVAVLLGVADRLRVEPPAVGVDLLFVDGEDYGTFPDTDVLIGSRYYARNQPPGPRPRYAVVLDMVGSATARFYQEGYSRTAAPEVVDLVWRTARELGHGDLFIARPMGPILDDHVPLIEAGIRAIDVIDDLGNYRWWHTPDDTLDKLSSRTLEAVGQVVLALIRRER
jgi:hypothetical protein